MRCFVLVLQEIMAFLAVSSFREHYPFCHPRGSATLFVILEGALATEGSHHEDSSPSLRLGLRLTRSE